MQSRSQWLKTLTLECRASKNKEQATSQSTAASSNPDAAATPRSPTGSPTCAGSLESQGAATSLPDTPHAQPAPPPSASPPDPSKFNDGSVSGSAAADPTGAAHLPNDTVSAAAVQATAALPKPPLLQSTGADTGATSLHHPGLLHALDAHGENLDDASMIPFVPGAIVFLHPLEQPLKKSSAPRDTATEHPSRFAGEGSTAADAVVAEVDGGPKLFERLIIGPDAVTLGSLRIHHQGLNDHYLDQYRSGLGMRALQAST